METELPASTPLSEGAGRASTDSRAGLSVSGYRTVAWESKPLDRDEMQQLSADGEHEKRIEKIRGRANYWLFDNPTLKSKEPLDKGRWRQLISNSYASDIFREEYARPNDNLRHPPEDFQRGFVKPYEPNHPLAAQFVDKGDPNDIIDHINKALKAWGTYEQEKQLRKAIDTISKPHQISKVVCFGLGTVKHEMYNYELPTWKQDNQCHVNQHAAAVMIVDQLQEKTGQKIELYVGDPAYGEPHKEVFQTWSWPSKPSNIKFNYVDATYNKHEHFTMVDDNTLVIEIGAFDAKVQLICSEYARPVAIIGQAIRKGPDGPVKDPGKDMYWYELEFENKKHPIPGSGKSSNMPPRVHNILNSEYKIVPEFVYRDQFDARDPYWGGVLMYVRDDAYNK